MKRAIRLETKCDRGNSYQRCLGIKGLTLELVTHFLITISMRISMYWPGPEKMKPKCNIEVKKSKSDVMLNNRLSYGQGQEK